MATKKTTPKKAATTAATKKAATKKAATKKAATQKAAAKQTATTKPATKKTATKQGSAQGLPAPRTRGPRKRTSLAAGASRAAAERRVASPLLRATAESAPEASGAARSNEPHLRVVPDPAEGWDERAGSPGAPTASARARTRMLDLLGVFTGDGGGNGIESAVNALANMLRVGATAAGMDTEQAEEQVARTLAYLRRRSEGDFAVDEFGFDEDFIENVWLPLLRPLYEKWFRVEVRGVENIPASGGALVVANHSGTLPVDGMMTQVAVHDEAGRHLRMLGADLVFELPFVGTNARRAGTTLATAADAERMLSAGEIVGVYPEGFKGIGKPYSERYKLQRFGRGGFVSAALRTGVPIIPCSIVGAEEIYPLIGSIGPLARLIGAPYFPVTPFFPLLGPLGLIPLPSKWIIAFGEAIDTTEYGPEGAEDPMLVFDLTDQVRETIQQTLYALLMQRRSVFF